MGILKKKVLVITVLMLSKVSYSQTKDSIPKKVVAYVADKFPATRAFNIEYSQLTPYDYTSNLSGTALPEATVKNLNQTKIDGNINFITKNRWILGAAFNYRYSAASTETDTPSGLVSSQHDFHYHATTLNFTHISRLWNKTVIYSSGLTVDGSDKHFERVKGMLTGIVILKANAQTKMGAGLSLMIDPNSQFPVIPSFSYEHKFSNGWMADVFLPQKVYLRKLLFNDGRLSFGSELAVTSFYLYNFNNSPQKHVFQQLEINSGAMYEHYFGSTFVGTLKTGLKTIPTSRIFEKNESPNDYIFKANPQSSFYVSIGLSFNPFHKIKKGRN